MGAAMMRLIALCLLLPMMGYCGSAIDLDGADDFINIGDIDAVNFGAGDWTYSVWVKRGSINTDDMILGKDSGGSNRQIILSIAPDNKVYILYFKATGTVLQNTTATYTDITSWHHIIALRRGNSFEIYIDGISQSLGSLTGTHGTMQDVTSPLYIGGRVNPAAPFSGSIDEVMIYNRALSVSEIKSIYASRNASYPKSGIVCHWTMDNNGINTGQAHPNGSTVKDSAGSNNGTISDGADGSMIIISSPTRKKRGRR